MGRAGTRVPISGMCRNLEAQGSQPKQRTVGQKEGIAGYSWNIKSDVMGGWKLNLYVQGFGFSREFFCVIDLAVLELTL